MSKTCFKGSVGDERCPQSGDTVSYHIQTTLSGLLDVPLKKPDMEQIFDCTHEIDVTKLTTITVKKPPGKKVLVVGTVMVGTEYIAKTLDQKVHFAHWDIPFQVLIKNDDGSLLDLDFNLDEYIVHVCVEHQKCYQVDERTVNYEVVLLIWLQRKDN